MQMEQNIQRLSTSVRDKISVIKVSFSTIKYHMTLTKKFHKGHVKHLQASKNLSVDYLLSWKLPPLWTNKK